MRFLASCWLLVAVLASPVRAEGVEPVPLFTNEDLEELYGPSDAPDRPVIDSVTGEEWAFVIASIERGYSRIEADRAHDLARLEAEPEPAAPRYALPWAVPYWDARPYRAPRFRPHPEPLPPRLPRPPIGNGADSVPEGGRLPPSAVDSRMHHQMPPPRFFLPDTR